MGNPGIIEMIFAFLIVLGPLILLHELGHFLVAKRAGIRALEFGMGYPPRAKKMWRGKGYIVVDGVRYETPRNFELPWDWLIYPNKAVTLTYDELNGKAVARSLELEPAAEAALLPAAAPTDQQALMASTDNQAAAPIEQHALTVPTDKSVASAPPPLLKRRNVHMQHGAHEISGIVNDLDPGTEYTLNFLPIGGFVRMWGEEGSVGQGSFNDAPKRWRAATLLAGPGMNLLIALVIFTLTYMLGYPEMPVSIREVAPGSPAAQSGLLPNDTIVSVGGVSIRRIDQVKQVVDDHAGQTIALVVLRNGKQTTLQLTPRTVAQTPAGQGKMGVVLATDNGYHLVQHPLGESVALALGDIGDTVRQIVTLPTRLLGGVIAPQEAQVVGPVGISQYAAAAVEQTARTGELFWFLNLFAAISLALAITNLLPLPALDGGRLIFVILEAVRHKRISPEREAVVHFIGMMVLLALMVLITIQDIGRLAN
jgi:regulator of sigma E protease